MQTVSVPLRRLWCFNKSNFQSFIDVKKNETKTSETSIVFYSHIKEPQTINPEHSLSKADDEKYGMSFLD